MKQQYERIEQRIQEQYGDHPDFPWLQFPEYEVFRHAHGRKWYGLIMNIAPEKLYAKNPAEKRRIPPSVADKKEIHILNLKMPQKDILELVETEGIFPAWHMNAGHWISVLLENILSDDFIMELVERSYALTAAKSGRA